MFEHMLRLDYKSSDRQSWYTNTRFYYKEKNSDNQDEKDSYTTDILHLLRGVYFRSLPSLLLDNELHWAS